MQSLIFSKTSKLLFDIEYLKKDYKMRETSIFLQFKKLCGKLKKYIKKKGKAFDRREHVVTPPTRLWTSFSSWRTSLSQSPEERGRRSKWRLFVCVCSAWWRIILRQGQEAERRTLKGRGRLTGLTSAWQSEKCAAYKAGGEPVHPPHHPSLWQSLKLAEEEEEKSAGWECGRISFAKLLSFFGFFLICKWRSKSDVCCFTRLQVKQAPLALTLKKWEYCLVQTSSQHVNVLPTVLLQTVGRRNSCTAQQDHETLGENLWKRSLFWQIHLFLFFSFFYKSMICFNTLPTKHSSPSTRLF